MKKDVNTNLREAFPGVSWDIWADTTDSQLMEWALWGTPVISTTDLFFDALRRKGYMPYSADAIRSCIWRLAHADTPDKREACVQELLLRNQGLVRSIVSRYQKPGIDIADLMSLWSLGLWRGIQKFNVAKTSNPVTWFTDYVSGWISSSISRSLPSQRNIRYPAHIWSKLAKCFRIYHQWENEWPGKWEEALMSVIGLSLAQLLSLWHNYISLDAPALDFTDLARVSVANDANDEDEQIDSCWYDTSRPNVPGLDHWCLDDQLTPNIDIERTVHTRSVATLRYESDLTLSDVLSSHHRMPHRNKTDPKQRKEPIDYNISKRSEAFSPATESWDSPLDILIYKEQNEMIMILAESLKTGQPYIFWGKEWSCPVPQERTRDILCRRWWLLSFDGRTETLEEIWFSGIIDDDGPNKIRKVVTRERVRQIQNAGILKLRSRMNAMIKEQHRADATMIRGLTLEKNENIFSANTYDASAGPRSITSVECAQICEMIAQELWFSKTLKSKQTVSDYDFLSICVTKILFCMSLEWAVEHCGYRYEHKFPGRAHIWSVRGYIWIIVNALQKRFSTRVLKWKANKKVEHFVLVSRNKTSEIKAEETSISE